MALSEKCRDEPDWRSPLSGNAVFQPPLESSTNAAFARYSIVEPQNRVSFDSFRRGVLYGLKEITHFEGSDGWWHTWPKKTDDVSPSPPQALAVK